MTALYTIYRSQRLDDLVGQDAVVQTLKNALRTDRVAHAYLFTGARGTGKTSTARLLAKAVNCLQPEDGEPCNKCAACVAVTEASATDLIEIDAASNRGIDEIRDLREKAKYMPALLRRKVYIIDEAHQLTPEAFNALLKTLEEPPPHVLFVLCTTEAHKMPTTIVSRCQRFEFRRISEDDIVGRLRHIGAREKLDVIDSGLHLLAVLAQGSMRDAISMLDQMASSGEGEISSDAVRRQLGLVETRDVTAMVAACARGDAGTPLLELERLAAQGVDMRRLAQDLGDVARRAVMVSLGAAPTLTSSDGAAEIAELAARAKPRFLTDAFELAMGAAAQLRQAHDPRPVIELLLVRMAGSAFAENGGDSPSMPVARSAPPAEPVVGGVPAAKPLEEERAEPAIKAAPAPEQPPVDLALEAVMSRWPALLAALPRNTAGTRVKALLTDGGPLALEEDLLTLGFRYAIGVEKAQEPVHRQELEAALHETYGRAFRLRFVVTEDGSATGAERPSGAAQPASDQGLSGEALVQAAVQELGARIKDVRPKKRE
jgi:DNA polymerase-3 subunit gamma/tau